MSKRDVEGMKDYFINVSKENTPKEYAISIERSKYLVQVIEHLFPDKEGFETMELGSNVGRNIHFLQEAGYSVWGIEGSELYYDAIQQFYPSVLGRVFLGQIEELLHNDKIMLPSFDLIFTMAVLEHIPHSIEQRVFTGIQQRAKWLLTVEDEQCNQPTHFPRKYNDALIGYGLEQVKAWAFPPLGKNFVMRLFKNTIKGSPGERTMIENSCFECAHFYRNVCGEFGYYFKDYVAKKSTCKEYKELEQ